MVRGEIDTIAHSTLSIGAPIKGTFGMHAGVFNKKRSALDQNDVFRSVRANENVCFLNQEASSSLQKAEKEKKTIQMARAFHILLH